MSRLWRDERAQSAASLGSFLVRPNAASFLPLAGQDGEASNDSVPADMAARVEEIAYLRGLDEGRTTAEAEFAAERDAIGRLAETLQSLRPEPTLPLAMLLAETVDRLVKQIAGEVEIDGLSLLARAKAAAALIGEATQPARLKVHPEDLALFDDCDLDIPVEGDLALERGAVMIETADGWIEDGPAIRLERLRAELDKVAAAR